MGTLPYQGTLLVSDVDGTLLPSSKIIPERNLKAIEEYVRLGGRLALATGRAENSVGRLARQLGVNAPCVLYNGSAIFDFSENRYLYSAYLPQEARQMMRLVLGRYPDVGAEVFSDGGMYLLNRNKDTDWHARYEKIVFEKAELDGPPHNWNKILFAGSKSQLEEVRAFIGTLPGGGIDYVYSSTMFFEALPAGVTKGSAVRILAEKLGISRERVFGIGDYFNDLGLIEEAAVSAVPENAPEELKAKADMVVCSCEEGAVADFIKRLGPELKSGSR